MSQEEIQERLGFMAIASKIVVILERNDTVMVSFFPMCFMLILHVQSRAGNQEGAAPRSCFTLFYFLGREQGIKTLFTFL